MWIAFFLAGMAVPLAAMALARKRRLPVTVTVDADDPRPKDVAGYLAEIAVRLDERPERMRVVFDAPSGIELDMEPPHYTIRTLDDLKLREPGNDFTLVIGADNLERFLSWRDAVRILTEYGVVVYPRKGFDLEQIKKGILEQIPLSKIEILNSPLVDISSTRIREGLAAGEDMSEWLM